MTKDETTIFMVDGPVFILNGTSLDKFCEKYGLLPFETECICGKIMKVDIPFRSKNRSGLCAKRCNCEFYGSDEENSPFTVSMTEEELNSGEPLFGF